MPEQLNLGSKDGGLDLVRLPNPSIELLGRDAPKPPRAAAPPSVSFGREGRPPSTTTPAPTPAQPTAPAQKPAPEVGPGGQGPPQPGVSPGFTAPAAPGAAAAPTQPLPVVAAEGPQGAPVRSAMTRSPTRAELALMAPGEVLDTPFGTVNKSAAGVTNLELNEAGRMRIAQNRVAARTRFGKTPIDGLPGAPEPPLVAGKPNFNAFSGEWS